MNLNKEEILNKLLQCLYNQWEDNNTCAEDPEICKYEQMLKTSLQELPANIRSELDDTVSNLTTSYCRKCWLDGFQTAIIVHQQI